MLKLAIIIYEKLYNATIERQCSGTSRINKG